MLKESHDQHKDELLGHKDQLLSHQEQVLKLGQQTAAAPVET